MRRRIIVCLGLLLVLCLLGDAIAMVCLGGSIQELRRLVDSHRIQSMRVELSASAVRVERDLLNHLVGLTPQHEKPHNSLQRFRQSKLRCTRCHHEPDIQSDLDAVQATFDAYVGVAEGLFARVERNAGPDRHSRALHDDLEHRVQGLADKLVHQTTDLADRADAHLAVRSADVVASIKNAWIVLWGTLIAALIVGGLVAFHLERRLTKPVTQLLEGIDSARHGELADDFAIEGDEEFRALGRAFADAYETLDTARASVLQAEKMAAMGRLAAGVAHEVGNPLASISAIAQVMQRHSASDEKSEQLGLIMEEVERISRIIREMLAFSRPSRDVSYDTADVGAILDHATTLLGYDKRAKNVDFISNYDSLPGVKGNRDQLLLVFTNVIFNAMDALAETENGTGHVKVHASAGEHDLVVQIEDNGSGMSDEERANAFEPFFTTKEPGVGTGLGLWICYQVVQRHKGTIELSGGPAGGTIVTITLPLDDESVIPAVTADDERLEEAPVA